MIKENTYLPHQNVLFVSNAEISMRSPQHWEQQAEDRYPKQDGTQYITTSAAATIQWNQL